MKKVFCMAGVLFITGALLYGDGFTVTAPAAGEEWCIGGTHVIRWRSTGIAGEVAIKLRPEAGSVINIKSSMANRGSFSWTIPAGVPPGRYRVRVQTVAEDPFVYDDSDLFTIKNCAASPTPVTTLAPSPYHLMPSLAVTFPGAGAELYVGTICQIRWRSTAVPGPVSIGLRRSDAAPAAPWQDIAPSTENDGTLGWMVPQELTPGEYRIRVATVSASPPLAAESQPFLVKPAVVSGTVIPSRIETLTMPVTFHTRMATREEHLPTASAIRNVGIVVPPSEFVVGYRTALRMVPFAYRSQVFRGSPVWDASRLHTLVGKTLTFARLTFRHKNTECLGNACGAYSVCLAKAYFYSGRMGEENPAPYKTEILAVVPEGGTYRIDVREMMSNWLREEEAGYAGEHHNYRIEFAGPNESRDSLPHRDEQCLSWFDNGVLTINYTD